VGWSEATGDTHKKTRNTGLVETAFYGNLLKYGQCGCVQYISVHFYSKTNQMHQFPKLFYFVVALYMFRTVFPSIIRSLRLILLTAC